MVDMFKISDFSFRFDIQCVGLFQYDIEINRPFSMFRVSKFPHLCNNWTSFLLERNLQFTCFTMLKRCVKIQNASLHSPSEDLHRKTYNNCLNLHTEKPWKDGARDFYRIKYQHPKSNCAFNQCLLNMCNGTFSSTVRKVLGYVHRVVVVFLLEKRDHPGLQI